MARSIGLRWLDKAEENLKLAKLALEHGIYSLSCFHSQQAAELAFKAILIGLAGVHLITHSLTRLASEARILVNLNLPREDDLRRLEDHYVQARYPNIRVSVYTLREAEEAYKTAEAIFNECSRAFREAKV